MSEFLMYDLKSVCILKYNDPFSNMDMAVIKHFPKNDASYCNVYSSGVLSTFGIKYKQLDCIINEEEK